MARKGERRNAYMVLVGELQGKRPGERPRRRWKNNFEMDLQEIGWGGGGGLYWIDMTQDGDKWRALVNTVMNFLVP
jgi:hypothetical protein